GRELPRSAAKAISENGLRAATLRRGRLADASSFPQVIQSHPISGCAFVLPERPPVTCRSLEGVLPCQRGRCEMFSVTPNQAGLTHKSVKIFPFVAGAQFQLASYVFGQHRLSTNHFCNSFLPGREYGLPAEEVAEFEAHRPAKFNGFLTSRSRRLW